MHFKIKNKKFFIYLFVFYLTEFIFIYLFYDYKIAQISSKSKK